MGVVQTIVGEIVKNPAHEPKAFAIMPFVWSVGTILGPAIGGTFADPVRGYPSVFPKGSLFEEYPWALPNIICSVIMLCSLGLVIFCLEETHPDHCKGADPNVHHHVTETTPMIIGGNNAADQSANLHDDHDTYGTFNEVEVTRRDSWRVTPDGTSRTSSLSERQVDKWFTWRVSSIVIALGIYTSRSSLLHMEGGLGLSTKMVGLIMTVGGAIALFIQAVIFPFVADRLGVFRTFMMVTLLHPIAFFIVPYLVFLPSDSLMVGIYVCLTIRHFCSILNYPSVLILLKQACPSPRYLGKINGLAASVGAACRMVAPPVAGLLYTKGRQIEFTGLAWFGAGAVAILGAFQVFSVPRGRADGAVVHSWTRRLSNAAVEDGNVPREVVNITIYDEGPDSERQ
ncbi:hypothetical protein LTR05_007853 [Lithohypha guttulata]|uniref:Major facilitator superfamily (MFS) profile domain-containing protein n=1 Tax=Lithohypha guttulata TaxID=1690604 RepID=A0AAN7YDC9_9EURO|nr:hypothetical protein LTR05_007853 [Lithohypha guttulata]